MPTDSPFVGPTTIGVNPAVRVMLAEHATLLREGIRSILIAHGHHVTAAYPDALGLLARLEYERPDVVVLDVRMPPTHTDEGLRATARIRYRWPEVGILVISQFVERGFAATLLGEDPRAMGYLLTERLLGINAFLEALRRVRDGGLVLDPEVVAQLFRDSAQELDGLTAREREVLGLLAEGRTSAGIAEALYVPASTVEEHSDVIFGKLGLVGTGGQNGRVLAVLRWLGA